MIYFKNQEHIDSLIKDVFNISAMKAHSDIQVYIFYQSS